MRDSAVEHGDPHGRRLPRSSRPAVTVWFELETGERILAWTTTPWTLPSNLALAVGPDIDYAVLEADGERWIIAESRLGAYEAQLGEEFRWGR